MNKAKKLLTAFTFIEILIGLTIFSIIALSLYSNFLSGTSVWKRSEEINRLYQEARWSLDTIAKELHNAIALDYKNSYPDFAVFKGNSDSLAFLIANDDGIKRINYFLEKVDESQNLFFALKRKETPLIDSLQTPEGESLTETFSSLVSEGGLKFSYSYSSTEGENEQIEWKGNWQDDKNLPKGLRIELALIDPLNPQTKKTFNKTVFIPLGVIAQAGQEE